MVNAAILLAGGSSQRMDSSIPKPYIKIHGRSILEICLEKFISHPAIDHIVIVVNKDHFSYFDNLLGRKQFSKDIEITEGGNTRALSTINGLKFLEKYNPINVLIHDIARPFCSSGLIDSILKGLESYAGVIPVTWAVDTIKELSNATIINTLDRDKIGYSQTPQGFKFHLISQLHYKNQDSHISDDSILLEREGIAVHIVKGEKNNQKITFMEDLGKFFQNITKIGQGFDVHSFKAPNLVSNNTITLGGVLIPYEYSIEAHSDGDVVLHALCDALLGSLGQGDIGDHFPCTDNQWANVSSSIFVEHVMRLIDKEKGKVINVDITILAEAPKISSYKNQMREVIANLLHIDKTNINIKATTTERLGFIGRKEGVASLATALVEFSTF
jgi:2-C-methyl-D-erythritol 4-phosphate cytidylyltransferase/2-C-methyl-D-erythritol 2,4-cyclodiphosphate synthase